MEFIADLHIHSSFSRATSRQMDLENLYIWAQLKGIEVISTGDFTHPRWYAELQEKLEPAEPGLYRLKDSYASAADAQVPETCRAPVRFMLSVEISTIYKKNDRTRKVHSLIMAPDLLAAGRLNAALQEIGNIASDGRPILGLDCKRLLKMTLDADSDNDAPTVAYVIECPCVCVEDHGGSGDDQHQTDGSDGKADDDGCPFRDTASDDCSDDSRD